MVKRADMMTEKLRVEIIIFGGKSAPTIVTVPLPLK
jgi:hypothetical protein